MEFLNKLKFNSIIKQIETGNFFQTMSNAERAKMKPGHNPAKTASKKKTSAASEPTAESPIKPANKRKAPTAASASEPTAVSASEPTTAESPTKQAKPRARRPKQTDSPSPATNQQ